MFARFGKSRANEFPGTLHRQSFKRLRQTASHPCTKLGQAKICRMGTGLEGRVSGEPVPHCVRKRERRSMGVMGNMGSMGLIPYLPYLPYFPFSVTPAKQGGCSP